MKVYRLETRTLPPHGPYRNRYKHIRGSDIYDDNRLFDTPSCHHGPIPTFTPKPHELCGFQSVSHYYWWFQCPIGRAALDPYFVLRIYETPKYIIEGNQVIFTPISPAIGELSCK